MTIANPTSGELQYSSATPVTSRTISIAMGTLTHGWLAVHVGVIAGGAVSDVQWNGASLTQAVESGTTVPSSDWWYVTELAGGTHDLVVSFAGSGATTLHIVHAYGNSDIEVFLGDTTINRISATTDPVSIDLDTTAGGALCLSGYTTQDNNRATSGETLMQDYDQGGNCFGASYLIAGAAGNYVMDWDRGAAGKSSLFYMTAMELYEASAGSSPTIILNTADDTEFTTDQPTLEFTGSDADLDDVRYNIQVTDNPTFTAGVIVTRELTSGSGTPIHPNPHASATTWEGYIQVDDRVGMAFQARGGILDSIDFSFGPHETTPADTDGSYLVHVYEALGRPIDTVPAIWLASTIYAVGDIVRPTSEIIANVHFVYRCTVAGTSSGSEPTWPGNGVAWKTIADGTTVGDGGVTWEALAGAYPVNPADPADTPTPGWLAVSTVYAYAPGVADPGWKTCAFTGANRIRLTRDAWYMAILDWRPVNRTTTNSIQIDNASLTNATAPGSVYLDGATSNNNGPRIIEDSWYRIREEFILLDKVSGTDAGFANTVTPSDTDPFNQAEKADYDVQVADALDDATYDWRVRAKDPLGTDTYCDWSTARSFTVAASGAIQLVVQDAALAITVDAPTLRRYAPPVAVGTTLDDLPDDTYVNQAVIGTPHVMSCAGVGDVRYRLNIVSLSQGGHVDVLMAYAFPDGAIGTIEATFADVGFHEVGFWRTSPSGSGTFSARATVVGTVEMRGGFYSVAQGEDVP